MLYLSKTKYCYAVQCPKMLWLFNHRPDAFDDSVKNQAVLDQGSEVGDLAMGLFGDYIEVPYSDNVSEMIKATDDLINADTPIIAEASFSLHGLFCSVDILLNHGNKHVSIVEVKSSTKVHDIYYHDLAYQVYVLTGLGYIVEKASLAHINNTYVRQGELDLQQLFSIEDLTQKVAGMQCEVEERIRFLTDYLKQEDEPECPLAFYCNDPYPCGFFGFCTRELPKPNIFDVSQIQYRTKLESYRRGIISFADIEKRKALKPEKMIQVSHELHDLPPLIDKEVIRTFLSKLSFPLYFLDFESFNSAVPLFDDSSPYEQIVFQYSLHYMENEGGELKHSEFLALPGTDPRRDVAEHLCQDIPLNVTTLAYNMSFEKNRIKRLADLYPDLANHLMNIHDHIVDLMVPFQKRQYYLRAMQGSYSIKYVLPALFPDDPALDYHNLEGVHNGAEASDTFVKMASMKPAELEIWRQNLLKYCGLDTFAMVKVWEKLNEVIREPS